MQGSTATAFLIHDYLGAGKTTLARRLAPSARKTCVAGTSPAMTLAKWFNMTGTRP